MGLPTETLAAAEEAGAEIARFDAEMGADIAPFAVALLRSESAASSQIENLTASARAIAEAEIDGTGRHNATQIVANSRSMVAAIRLADQLDADAILAMHSALMEDIDPGHAGRWREEPVWIGGGHVGPHQAQFVPPQHTRIPEAVDDLVAFLDRDDLPILPQAALAHAQFETIHPFTDGNGRTGRALIHALLRAKGLTRSLTVPVSAGLLVDTEAYFSALTAYREGSTVSIVEQLTGACFRGVSNGRELVTELRTIRAGWSDRVAARGDSDVWKLAELLVRRPVVNAALVAEELGLALPNVYRHIDRLLQDGVLTEFTDRKRHRAWRSDEVLAALDAFAARAGRRG